jgi:hypothetical protein
VPPAFARRYGAAQRNPGLSDGIPLGFPGFLSRDVGKAQSSGGEEAHALVVAITSAGTAPEPKRQAFPSRAF